MFSQVKLFQQKVAFVEYAVLRTYDEKLKLKLVGACAVRAKTGERGMVLAAWLY